MAIFPQCVKGHFFADCSKHSFCLPLFFLFTRSFVSLMFDVFFVVTNKNSIIVPFWFVTTLAVFDLQSAHSGSALLGRSHSSQ